MAFVQLDVSRMSRCGAPFKGCKIRVRDESIRVRHRIRRGSANIEREQCLNVFKVNAVLHI